MSRKNKAKPYWEMNVKELAEATAEFDQEFVFEKGKPLSPEMRARWEAAKAKGKGKVNGEQVIALRIDKALLDQCTVLAKKKRISRDALIARGIKALLAANGK